MCYPVLTEADELRVGIGLSVEQPKPGGRSRKIDDQRPFRRMGHCRLEMSIHYLHCPLIAL